MTHRAVKLVGHLQAALLLCLGTEERSGDALRLALLRLGAFFPPRAVALYQLLQRMERGGLLAGRFARVVVRGQPCRERRYRATPEGRAALSEVLNFYRPWL